MHSCTKESISYITSCSSPELLAKLKHYYHQLTDVDSTGAILKHKFETLQFSASTSFPSPKKNSTRQQPRSFKYKSTVSANLSQDRQTSEVLDTVVAQIQDQFSSI
jgi:hypothetical protein